MSTYDEINACLACESESLQPHTKSRAQMHGSDTEFSFVRCEDCGHIMLNPRVAAEDLGDYYTEYYLPFRGPEAWGRFRDFVAGDLERTDRKRLARAKAACRLSSDTRVLDVGCGKPSFLKRLQAAHGCKVTGIDFSDEGWKHEPGQYEGIDLHVTEFGEFEPAERYDLITMWHYLEHDYQPLSTLRQMKKVASEDASLIIEVPDYNSWTRVLQGSYWAGYHTPRHTSVFSPASMRTLLEHSGWKVESIRRDGTLSAFPLFWMGRQERKGIDWSGSMEEHFVPFVAGMVLTSPLFALKRVLPGGIMTIVARPA